MKNKTYDRLLFIDTETGGIDPQKHSLLSIGCVVWDRKEGILAKKEYFVRHKNYITTKESQKINGFNQNDHESKAIDGSSIIVDLLDFCSNYFEVNTLIPLAGHNTQFDVGFLKMFLIDNGRSFNSIFSHRIIDTYSIIKFLEYSNIIRENVSSSAQAFNYFGIKVENRHSALDDALATVQLFENALSSLEK